MAMAFWNLLLAYLISTSRALTVRNCTKIRPQVGPDEAYKAAIRGGQYIAKHVRDDGTFDYLYSLERDLSSQHEYNWVRHAGATYALFELYDREKEDFMLSRGRLALDTLTHKIVTCRDGMSLDQNGSTALGHAGLALMALSSYQRATKDTSHQQMMHEVANWILAKQRPNGTFEEHDFDVKTGKVLVQRNPFGVGEALLSLIRLYQMDAKPKYLSAVTKGIDAMFATYGDSTLSVSVHWLAPALRFTHDFQPQKRHVDYARRLVKGMEAKMDARPMCVPGKTDNLSMADCWSPCSTACMMDGASAFWAILEGERVDGATAAFEVLEPLVKYIMKSHIGPKKAQHFRNPSSALGGLMGDGDLVRIDDVQHASTALLAYAEAVKLLGAC